MKDYYYFLGIHPNASSEDIKKAYRKLSLKYHPDKNDNDKFFENRFREIQEAYEILTDPEKKQLYDRDFNEHHRSFKSSLPPFIKTFSANKIRAQKGEEIMINWQTNHADVVKILPFGLAKSYGEKTFKITEFKEGKFHVVLHATNSLLNKTIVKGITITEIFEHNKDKFSDNLKENHGTFTKKISDEFLFSKYIKIVTAILLIIAAICLLYKSIF